MSYLIRRVLAKPRLILDEMCRLYGKFASYEDASYFSSYKLPQCEVKSIPGGTPLYRPCGYVPPQRVGFCVVLVLEKTEIDFVHFDLELGMVFKELRERMKSVKEKYAKSKWISLNFFCCCSINLSIEDIISETGQV